jgi:predicted HicB family RNase H-like nuclease
MNAMIYKGYIAYVAFNARARSLIGQVVGVREIAAFRGTTVDELEAAFHASVDAYLVRCSELKRTPERPTFVRATLRIGADLHASADRAARRSGKSLNQ